MLALTVVGHLALRRLRPVGCCSIGPKSSKGSKKGGMKEGGICEISPIIVEYILKTL